MIDSLQIRKVASFDDEGAELIDLKKVNFIYGSNGSGKTTISNLVYSPDHEKFESCSLAWNGGMEMETLVYNKDFRDRNFGKESIPGVFTLGEATKEEIAEINEKEEELAEIAKDGKQKRAEKEQTEKTRVSEISTFRESAWTRFYKKYETTFKETFTGHQGSKQKFYEKLKKEFNDNSAELRNLEELKKKAATIFGKPPKSVNKFSLIDYSRISEIERHPIWKKKIVGKSDVGISKFIQRLNINDWVNEGRKYVETNSETCPFCQKETISAKLKSELEEYFDETYAEDLETIRKIGEEYLSLTSSMLFMLDEIERICKESDESFLDLTLFSAKLSTLKARVQTNKERQASKAKEPSREFQLTSEEDDYLSMQEMLVKGNEQIDVHNEIVTNFYEEKQLLIDEVWKYLVTEGEKDIDTHVKKIKGLQASIDKKQNELEEALKNHSELKNEIAKLNKNVTSVKPAVEEINRTLLAYGFSNFSIVPSDKHENRYQIKRENGELAESTLSEGEITFITFLYFLQRTKGGFSEDSVSTERVLVIDDPISSLDSTVLFVVSSLIKEILKQVREGTGSIKQAIILTHNVYFHKEVSFIDGRTFKLRDTNYWIIRKKGKVSSIQAFGQDNPISTSYELLWKELIEREHNSGIAIQNIMRRIIENYFKILGKYGDDDLILRFDTREDQEICRSLISWINDGSHSIAEDLYVEVPDDTIERYFEVFEKIFINTGHEGHYKMMMGIKDDEEELIEA